MASKAALVVAAKRALTAMAHEAVKKKKLDALSALIPQNPTGLSPDGLITLNPLKQ